MKNSVKRCTRTNVVLFTNCWDIPLSQTPGNLLQVIPCYFDVVSTMCCLVGKVLPEDQSNHRLPAGVRL